MNTIWQRRNNRTRELFIGIVHPLTISRPEIVSRQILAAMFSVYQIIIAIMVLTQTTILRFPCSAILFNLIRLRIFVCVGNKVFNIADLDSKNRLKQKLPPKS